MPISGGIITKPVDIFRDLGVGLLGQNTGDLGYIIQNAVVNKFAKYKAVPLSTVGLTGRSSGNTYWKGIDGRCGLGIQDFSEFGNPGNSAAFAYKLLNDQLGWTYNRPTGGARPYRALDFDGYNAGCVPFMEPLSVFNYTIHSDGTLQIDFDFVDIQDDDNLKLSDVEVNGTSLNNWYFGILVYYNSSAYEFHTSQTVIGNGNLSVTFSGMGGWAGRTVQIVPFLSSIRMTTQSTAVTGGYYISFNLSPASCTLAAATSGIDVWINQALWNVAGTSLSYEFELRNSNASAFTVQNIAIVLWEGHPNDQFSQQVGNRTIASLQLAAGATGTITGTFSYNKNQNLDYYLSIMTVGNNVIPFDYTMTEDDEPIE